MELTDNTQQNKNFMKSDYGDNKFDKSNEINPSMTIEEKPQDELTRKILNLGGNREWPNQ